MYNKNNKRVLKRYPNAIPQPFKVRYNSGFRSKGSTIWIIKKSKYSKFCIGWGDSKKEAWHCANIILTNSGVKEKLTYTVDDCRLEME